LLSFVGVTDSSSSHTQTIPGSESVPDPFQSEQAPSIPTYAEVSRCLIKSLDKWFGSLFTDKSFLISTLNQLAVLTREVGDLIKMVDSRRAFNDNQTTDLAVAEGALQTVAAVEALDQKCGDSSTKQFLASIWTLG